MAVQPSIFVQPEPPRISLYLGIEFHFPIVPVIMLLSVVLCLLLILMTIALYLLNGRNVYCWHLRMVLLENVKNIEMRLSSATQSS